MNQLNPGLPRNWQKNFYIFLTGQFLSGITSMIVQYSIIWYLTMQTKSATILSIATILGMLPMVLLSPFIGGLIDRTNKKALLIITDAVVAFFAVILSIAGSFKLNLSTLVSLRQSLHEIPCANFSKSHYPICHASNGGTRQNHPVKRPVRDDSIS